MICKPCKLGGGYNHAALLAISGAARKAGFQMAAAHHESCKGGTWCDCQHVLGHVISSGKEAK